MMTLIFTTIPSFSLLCDYSYINYLFCDVCEQKVNLLAQFWVTLHFHHRARREYLLIKKQWSEERKWFPRIVQCMGQNVIKETDQIGAIEKKGLLETIGSMQLWVLVKRLCEVAATVSSTGTWSPHLKQWRRKNEYGKGKAKMKWVS